MGREGGCLGLCVGLGWEVWRECVGLGREERKGAAGGGEGPGDGVERVWADPGRASGSWWKGESGQMVWRGLEFGWRLGEATQGQEPEPGEPHYSSFALFDSLLPPGWEVGWCWLRRRGLERFLGDTDLKLGQTKQSWLGWKWI